MAKTVFGSEVELIGHVDRDGYILIKRLSDGAEGYMHESKLTPETDKERLQLTNPGQVAE